MKMNAECSGKFGFESKEMANKVSQRHGRGKTCYKDVYKCKICGLFHLAHADKMQKQVLKNPKLIRPRFLHQSDI